MLLSRPTLQMDWNLDPDFATEDAVGTVCVWWVFVGWVAGWGSVVFAWLVCSQIPAIPMEVQPLSYKNHV